MRRRLAVAPGPFASVEAVKAANARAGQHYFEPSTMRFFASRVGESLHGGRFFVTSEKGPYGPRAYSVRVAFADGHVDTLGEFQGLASSSRAHTIAERAARGRVEVRHDPYPGPEAERPPRRRAYEWRAYVVLDDGQAFAVGTRTTHHRAHGVKRELAGC